MKAARASVLALALVAGAACMPAQAADATVVQPRPFGYTVGDIATQRVLLARDGRTFDPSTLPEPGRANVWLERRVPRIELAADGQRWLVVDYQVVNAPRALAGVPLPAWDLPARAGAPALHVPAATLSVGALTAPAAAGEPVALRPEHPAPAIATAAMQRQLLQWLAALAATLACWGAYLGWNAWRDRRVLPFAVAGRELRELRSGAGDPAAAHRVLHRAFDRTAGAVVHGGALAPLFERAPWLQPLAPQIARFYAESGGLFFGQGLPAGAEAPDGLCRQLRRLERRHAP